MHICQIISNNRYYNPKYEIDLAKLVCGVLANHLIYADKGKRDFQLDEKGRDNIPKGQSYLRTILGGMMPF